MKKYIGMILIACVLLGIPGKNVYASAGRTLLSTYKSTFEDNDTRGVNIRLASEKLNKTTVKKGDIISFDVICGTRTLENGYKQVNTVGDGICQVSSDLYMALLQMGITPVERANHYIGTGIWYVPMGFDVAISEGKKDFKFSNPYEEPIYIESLIQNGTHTINIYGDKDLLSGYTYKPLSEYKGETLVEREVAQSDGSILKENVKKYIYESYLVEYKNGKEIRRIHLDTSLYDGV